MAEIVEKDNSLKEDFTSNERYVLSKLAIAEDLVKKQRALINNLNYQIDILKVNHHNYSNKEVADIRARFKVWQWEKNKKYQEENDRPRPFDYIDDLFDFLESDGIMLYANDTK